MELKRTERGFDFYDYNKESCIIQKSSLCIENGIWIGIRNSNMMHLTQEQVKALLPIFELFVKTGEIV